MKVETSIKTILLCAALALSACSKKTITPAEDPQPAEVGFTASSQAALVKSDTRANTPLSQFHQNFGVWGIARHPLNMPYILWDDNNLAEVRNDGSGVYTPVSNAYWFNEFTYNFIAIAPYNSGLSNLNINSATNSLSFDYDIANKYAIKGTEGKLPKDHYEFDLMGAVERTTYTKGQSSTQNLIFWHLFSKISIKVQFVNESGTAITTAAVSQIRIAKVDSKRNLEIGYVTPATSNIGNLSVTCSALTPTTPETTLYINASDPKDEDGRWNVHILPQRISDIELQIDYSITEGDKTINYSDVIKLTNSQPANYISNETYNWNIKITPKGPIEFKVSVDPWNETPVGDEVTII